MNTLIIGAGGLGTAFGLPLIERGHTVTFFVKEETASHVQQFGLTRSGHKPHTFSVNATSQIKRDAAYDLVILTLKMQDLEALLGNLSSQLPPQQSFLTLQNGIEAEDLCARFFPEGRIVGGVAYVDAWIERTGVVYVEKPGRLAIGPAHHATTELVTNILHLFSDSNVEIREVEDIRKIKWKKLSWNSIFNPLCVLHQKSVADVRRDAALKARAEVLLHETVSVAQKEGIELDTNLVEQYFGGSDTQGSGAEKTRTSMWADYIRHRRTEIDFLNGAIVRKGRQHGVPTPEHELLIQQIHQVTTESTKR